MAKKIYDIVPPNLAHKVEDQIKEFLGVEKSKKRSRGRKKEKHFPLMPVIIGGSVVVLLLLTYLFFKLPKADVDIWPKLEVMSYQQSVAIDQAAGQVDLTGAIIPAQYLEEEKIGSQDFDATGNASNEGKAGGKITVYNKNDPPKQITLKKGTHFLSDSQKYFVSLSQVIIPAAKKSGKKITPGSVEINVEAAEGGEGYNIKPASFSVPKLAGTSYYYSVYAESDETMTGGFAGKVKKVTEEDVLSAKDALVKKLSDEAKEALKNKISSDYVIAEGAIVDEIIEASSQVKVGTVVDKFTYRAKVKVKALAFKKSDLEKFAKDYIISQLPESKIMLDKSFTSSYVAENVDMSGRKAVLTVDFSSGMYKDIDKGVLITSFLGKDSGQMSQIIEDNYGEYIEKAKIKLWPFWVSKAPKSRGAVKVDLIFD